MKLRGITDQGFKRLARVVGTYDPEKWYYYWESGY